MLILKNDGVTIGRILILQFIILLVISLFFTSKDPRWGVAAFAGGLALCIPNVIFTLITQCKEGQPPLLGTITWTFFIGWILKILITIALLIIMIGIFKNEIIPLGIAFLAMLLVHMLAPLVIDSYCNYTKFRKG